jgi:hypothetical protein
MNFSSNKATHSQTRRFMPLVFLSLVFENVPMLPSVTLIFHCFILFLKATKIYEEIKIFFSFILTCRNPRCINVQTYVLD